MPFTIELVTPEKTALSGEADFVLARSLDGDIGVLSGHAPMLVGLDIGLLEAHMHDGEVIRAAVHGGFMEVSPERVSVLADVTELSSEIDLERAERARDEAVEALGRDETDETKERLKRAETRLTVAERTAD